MEPRVLRFEHVRVRDEGRDTSTTSIHRNGSRVRVWSASSHRDVLQVCSVSRVANRGTKHLRLVKLESMGAIHPFCSLIIYLTRDRSIRFEQFGIGHALELQNRERN